MIKKGSLIFLLIFALFLGFLGGTLFGRRAPSSNAVITEESILVSPAEEATQNNATGKININTASVTLLQSLPNIGETLAQRIVDYRTQNGDFASIDDLLNIKGIGESKLNDIRPYVTVGG